MRAMLAVVILSLCSIASAQPAEMVDITIDGKTARVPKGMVIEHIEKNTSTSAHGSSFEGDPETAKSFSSETPGVTHTADGDTKSDGSFTTFAGRKVSGQSAVLYVLGALALVAGIAVWVLTKRSDWGGIGVGSGIVLIMRGIVAENYLWAALVGVFLVVAVGAGWLVYKIKTNGVPQVEAAALKTKLAILSESVDREFATMIDDAKQRAIATTDPSQIAEWTTYVNELTTRYSRIVK